MKIKSIVLILLCSPLSLLAQQLEIFFDFDQHNLNAEAMRQLNQWTGENRNVQISKIYGYCDYKGTSKYNDTLSLQRVDAVYNFLKNSGIKILPEYEAIGFGKDFDQAKEQRENRKVVVSYAPKIIQEAVKSNPESLENKVKNAKAGDKIKLENIIFYNMSSRVVSHSLPELYNLLCVLEENPNLKIEIQGHICCQTNKDTDLTYLSTQRAKIIYSYLIRNKINRTRLSFKGYGVQNPVFPIPEKDEKERDANRRVEILIVEN